MKNKLVVYTALFGDYDDLIEPKEKFEGCDFICFTDQEHLKSDIWEIRLIKECDMPPNMMNRKYKILPHLFLSEYEWSLYVDANIAILNNPHELANKYLTKYDMAVPKHQDRDCLYDECEACIPTGKVKEVDLALQQMNYYKHDRYPSKNGLYEMNIIFRLHNDNFVIKTMNFWWKELNIWAKRDQLSFGYSLWKNNLRIKVLSEMDAMKNNYFNKENFNLFVFIKQASFNLK